MMLSWQREIQPLNSKHQGIKVCASTLQVERVTVEAEHVGDPSVAPRDQQHGPPAWRPYAFKISIPPNSPPFKALPFATI